ncbi:MAG: S8 family serine peptidase [Acidobacteriota bacterium]|nr:S8 family serine peptidase [Acidobacteriota bacterium]
MSLHRISLALGVGIVLLQLNGWGQTAPGLKLDSRLREARADSIVSVFIQLANQPRAEIQRQVEERFASRKSFAEERYGRAARLQFLVPGELESAAGDVDSVTLEIRQTTAREMAAAVQWEQDLIETSLRSLGAVNIQRFTILNMLSADIPASSLAALESDPAIAKIWMSQRRHTHLVNSSPSLGAPAFWNNATSYTGAGQSVAIVDTGIFGAHPAFGTKSPPANSKNTISGAPCANTADNTDTVDRVGHGSHVAGIVGSGGAPGWTQYFGVAKGILNIFMAKAGCTVPNQGGSFSDSDILTGLQWILSNTPARIINMSLGSVTPATQDDDFFSSTLDQLARDSDLIFSISAGNSGSGASTMTSPGIAYNILSVAAMDDHSDTDRSNDTVAGFSSRGPTVGGRKKPDIAAPGAGGNAGIVSVDHNSNGFVGMQGTSMAAPHIGGSAALLRQAGVTSSLAIKALLLNSTGSAAWDSAIGWGYANLSTALAQVSNTLTGSVPAGLFRLYRGPTGSSTATLVWDRDPNATPSNLDLALYDRSGGALAAVSNSTVDNVEKATASTTGNIVVKVKSVSATAAEPFALATSTSGFVSATGPVLSVNCSGPSTLAPSASGSFLCTIQNTGDLEAFGVSSTLALNGGGPGTAMSLGTLSPAGSASRTWNITAPSTGGQYTLQNSVTSTSYQESFPASGSVNFTVCTYGLSPISHTALAFAEPSDSFTVTTPSACAWSASTTDSWISITSGSGPGNGSVAYKLTANNTGSARSGSISVAGISFPVTQPCAFCGSNPVPADTATGVSLRPTLTWPSVSGSTSYDLSFGTTNPPPVFASGIASNTWPITGPLNFSTKYYWSVTAKNGANTVQSPVWSFTTIPMPAGGGQESGFVDMAGDTQGGANVPKGATLFVRGWAVDTVAGAPVQSVTVFVDGNSVGTATLGDARPDVAQAYNSSDYTNSGWHFQMSTAALTVGQHSVTASATGPSGNGSLLRNRTVNITAGGGQETGYVDMAGDTQGGANVPKGATLFVRGWAADTASGAPVQSVTVLIDGNSVGTATLGISRPDVAQAFNRSDYTNSGWSFQMSTGSLSVGQHSVTAMATGSSGTGALLRTGTVNITAGGGQEIGYVDMAGDTQGGANVSKSATLFVRGWAADTASGAPVQSVTVLIDGNSAGTATLGISRPDVAQAFNRSDYTNSGWSFQMSAAPLSVGQHSVTATASGSSGTGPLTRTQTINITP